MSDLTPAPFTQVVARPGGRVVSLPSGFQVAVRNPKALRMADRAAMFTGMTEGPVSTAEAGFGVLNRLLAVLITGWDVRDVDDDTLTPVGDVLPLPTVTDTTPLDRLLLSDGTELEKVAEEARAVMMPDFSPNPDESSPTPPSAG